MVMQNSADTLENGLASFSKKLNMQLSYDLAIMLLGIIPEKLKLTVIQNPVQKCSQKLYL